MMKGLTYWIAAATWLPSVLSAADAPASADAPAQPPAGTPVPSPNPPPTNPFPVADAEIARYTAYRVTTPLTIDGRPDEAAWKAAPRSPRFVDLISGAQTLYKTSAAVLWDDQYLYVSYEIEEPKLHAKYQQHDDPIYYDNDVEFFIAGRDAYYEFEINGFNTSYEVFFIWEEAYEKSGLSGLPDFARANLKPFNGVGFTHHPRGGRLGQFTWSFPGKLTAVAMQGTVNDDSDIDTGWTVELAFPWKTLELLARADGRAVPPKEGDVWRMDFSRFNTSKAPAPAKDSGGWVWTHHGIWDSHIPECFAYIRFSTEDVLQRQPAPPK